MTREEKEQRIRDLKQELFYSEDFGDWKMAKALEDLFGKIASAKTVIGIVSAFTEVGNNLTQAIQARMSARQEIEELERELENENAATSDD